MKIKRFNESNDWGYYSNDKKVESKFYVFAVSDNAKTYRGSIWDSESEPWVPDSAKLIAEFDTRGLRYMVVSQEELDEINQIKADNKTKEDTKKYNL